MSTPMSVERDELPEPPTPHHQLHGPSIDVRAVLLADAIAPAATLLQRPGHVPENKPVPFSRYVSREFYDLEMSRMWGRVWQYVAWTYDIAKPGDVSVYRNAGRSAIIVRQRDGSLKAFINSCLHRGREIVGENSRQQQLRCPYHGFTWNLEGACKWIPSAWDFPQIERQAFRLLEIPVAEWNGFVFINFDVNAKPLSQYLGRMVDQWVDWDFTKNRYRAATAIRTCAANWKAVMDAFIETLHVTSSHPGLSPMTPDTDTQYDVWPDEPHFSRFHSFVGIPSANITRRPSEQEVLDAFTSSYWPEIFGTPHGDLLPGENARQALDRLSRKVYRERLKIDADQVPAAELIDGTEYSIFPSFVVWPSYSFPLVYCFRPGDDPDTCIWEVSVFPPFEGERPPSGPVHHLGLNDSFNDVPGFEHLGPVLEQDIENIRHMQNGMKANRNGSMTLSNVQEQRIRHYHQTIDRYIEGTL